MRAPSRLRMCAAIHVVSVCACVVEARSLFTAARCCRRAHVFENESRESEFSGGSEVQPSTVFSFSLVPIRQKHRKHSVTGAIATAGLFSVRLIKFLGVFGGCDE